MQRAQIDLAGMAIGATPNDHLNSLFVARAIELFQVPRGAVALNSLPNDKAPDYLERHSADVLFDGPHDLERWDVRWRHGYLRVETFVRAKVEARAESDGGNAASAPAPGGEDGRGPAAGKGDRFVVLAIRRGRRTLPMTLGHEVRARDVAVVALYEPEREEALAQLAAAGWQPGGEAKAEPEAPADPPTPPSAGHGWT